ncbi:MAG TPA: TonB-dependent receptor [Saprospiraceae bacterium]|nr:TonB-dependent receptor [Saprospiraceae bacterium]
MQNKGIRFLFLLLFSSFGPFLAAQIQISGIVTGAGQDSSLVGATIQALPNGPVATTNDKGFFSLSTSADSLKISYLGFTPSIISPLSDGSYYQIQLQSDATLPTLVVQAEPQVSLRTAEAVSLLQKRDLGRLQQLNPQQIFNQIPGLYMQSGALNTNRITIRGVGNRSPFGTAKIRAYLDEIPLTSGVGETTIEDIDLSLVDQIEVYKGPTAGNYGAALGGMIHLKTAQPSREATSLSLQQEIGDYGRNRQVIQSQYSNPEENLLLQLNYNNTHSDGYRDNNEYDREGFTAIGKIGAGQRHRSTVLVNYTDVKAFIPSSINETDFRENPQKAAFTWAQVEGFEDYERVLAGISHTYDWLANPRGEVLSSTLSLFGTYRDNYESRPFNILRESNWATGYRLTLDYRKGRQRRQPNAQIGLEFFNESYQWTTNETDQGTFGDLLSDNDETRRYLNLFAGMDWPISPLLTLKAGFNYNTTQYNLQDYFPGDGIDISGDYQFDAVFSPRLSLNYNVKPGWDVFATISHGFSMPTLEETLNPDGSRNTEIQPERGWNYEIGAKGSYIEGRLHYDLALYSMRIQDLLVARRTGLDQFIGINAGRTVHNGLEASLRYQWLDGPQQLTTQASYQYAAYRFEKFVDGDQDYSGNELTGQPPHRFSAWADFSTQVGLYTNISMEYVDAFPMRDDNSIYSEAYAVAFAKIGFRKMLFDFLNIDAYFGVNNISDEKYASMILINAASFGGSAPRYYYPGRPRNIYGGLRLGYTL